MSSNIIFMGTPDFAIPALKEINKYFKLSCVISQPAKKAKRGHNICLLYTSDAADEE